MTHPSSATNGAITQQIIPPQFSQQIPVPFNSVGSLSIGSSNSNVVSSEKLSDRLEITELSDHEGGEFEDSSPRKSSIFSKSSGGANEDLLNAKHKSPNGGREHQQVVPQLRRQQSKLTQNSNGIDKKEGNNIFDMPSGLY